MSDLSESVKIPGFRKGKIPSRFSCRGSARSASTRRRSTATSAGFWSAATRAARPVSDPQYEFELPERQTRHGASSRPSRSSRSRARRLDDARGPARGGRVPQESVDAEIEALRESVAELAPAGERPAQAGDTLLVDLVDSDGEAQPDTVVELGGGRLAPEIEAALVGAKPVRRSRSRSRSRRLELDRRDHRARGAGEGAAGARRRARARRERVRHARRAAREHRGTLREQLDAEIDAAFRMSAVDELVRASQVQPAIPLVRTRAADLLTGFVRSLERRGVSLETYLAASGGSAQDLERQMVLEAAVSVARELALEALAEKAGSRSPTTT